MRRSEWETRRYQRFMDLWHEESNRQWVQRRSTTLKRVMERLNDDLPRRLVTSNDYVGWKKGRRRKPPKVVIDLDRWLEDDYPWWDEGIPTKEVYE